jgi:hypothetical protein
MIWDMIVKPITDIINKVIPDKAAQDAAKAQLEQMRESDEAKAVEDELQLQLAAMANIQAEAKGESWLQRNWRPIVALFLTGLVGSYWFGYTAPNLTPASIDDLFSLVKICLGGYVGGRSIEKIAPHAVQAIKAFKS